MYFTVVLLILISGVLIFISYRISDRKVEENGVDDSVIKSHEDKINNIIKDSDKQINENVNAVIEETNDKLSQISNEKIMAVEEFSQSVLENINKNHQEVMFLYSMLNDKEEELKKTINNPIKKQETKDVVTNQQDREEITDVAENDENNHIDEDKINRQINYKLKQVLSENDEMSENYLKDTDTLDNHNEEIIQLYSQGKSNKEIAKTLGIGTGEVKLVVELYQGVKA